MKHLKFVFLGLGALFVLSLFVLGYYKLGDQSRSLWSLGGESDAPKFVKSTRMIALVGSLATLGFAGLMIYKQQMTRLFAVLTLVSSLIVCYSGIGGFPPGAPFANMSAIGAKILLFGGLASFVLAIVAVIKPEKRLAA